MKGPMVPQRMCCFVDDVQWKDTCTYNAETDRMVPTIREGSVLKVELMLSVEELRMFVHSVSKTDRDGSKTRSRLLEQIIPTQPWYHFSGRVMKVTQQVLPRKDPLVGGLVLFFAEMDCGRPVVLGGTLAKGDPLLDITAARVTEGKWIEGVASLWANVSWAESPWERQVTVAVEHVEEYPYSFDGTPWSVVILTLQTSFK